LPVLDRGYLDFEVSQLGRLPVAASSPSWVRRGVAGLLFEQPAGPSGDGEAGDGFVFGGELFAGEALKCGAVVGVGEGGFEAVEFVLFLPCSGEAGALGVVPPGSCFG